MGIKIAFNIEVEVYLVVFYFFELTIKKNIMLGIAQYSFCTKKNVWFRHYSEFYYQLLEDALRKFYASFSALKILIDNMWKILYKLQWYIYIREERKIECFKEQIDTEKKIDGKRIWNEPVSMFFNVLFSQEAHKI